MLTLSSIYLQWKLKGEMLRVVNGHVYEDEDSFGDLDEDECDDDTDLVEGDGDADLDMR